MKKFISLLLVLALALTLVPMTISAEGEAYGFEYDSAYECFTMTTGIAAKGGRIALRFETAKVRPLSVIVTGSGRNQTTSYEEVTSETTAEIWGEFNYTVAPGATFYAQDEKYTYVGLDWYNDAELAAGTELGYLYIVIEDESALDNVSIVGVTDDEAKAVDGFIPVSFGQYGSVIGSGITEAMPLALTYPNSTKTPAPAGPVEAWTVENGTASATVVYEAEVSGTPMIAVYDANGTMIGFEKATEAVSAVKSFTIDTTYTGTANQAKVFVWNGYTAAVAAKLWK